MSAKLTTNDTYINIKDEVSVVLVDEIHSSQWLYDVQNVTSGQISFGLASNFTNQFIVNGSTSWFV